MRARRAGLATGAALLLLLTACGSHGDNTQSPAPASSTDLTHLQKLVKDAESAASSAESDMARE
ncbi:hypothetical protein GCM10011579_063040 [Streptomyces albiflavescens]|uniref:Lipoprotein n=1 Tax=Streptomyces albiflavescens TaxID=1623582 RepID=A0A917YBE3_9ACTN|nr:hypothetical protein [Streptomyces albiflavescens]GGN79073.1 hypothetical protein GCM10011579_063040 [Streptomyces albiflavescens]